MMNHRARCYLLNLLDEPAPGARFNPSWRGFSAWLASRNLSRKTERRRHARATVRVANFADLFGRALGRALDLAEPEALGTAWRKVIVEAADEMRRAT